MRRKNSKLLHKRVADARPRRHATRHENTIISILLCKSLELAARADSDNMSAYCMSLLGYSKCLLSITRVGACNHQGVLINPCREIIVFGGKHGNSCMEAEPVRHDCSANAGAAKSCNKYSIDRMLTWLKLSRLCNM